MASPAYGTNTTAGNAVGTSLSLNKPASTVDNDLLVVLMTLENANAITAPAGWTKLTAVSGTQPNGAGTDYQFNVWWKRASGEGASWNWTWTNSNHRSGVCVRYTGAVTTGDPWEASTGLTISGAAGTSQVLPTVTTTTIETLLIYLQTDTGGSATIAGATERVDFNRVYVADEALATATTSTARTITNGTSQFYSVATLALRSVAPSSGTTVTLTSEPASATSSAIAPSIVLGSVTVAPAVAAGTATAIAPSVMLGSLTISAAAAQATSSAVAPSVLHGALTISPAAAHATATAVDPTVEIAGGGGAGVTVELAASPAIATATALAPSVILSSLSVAPDAASAVTSAIAPSLVLSSLTIDLAALPATATATAIAPTVTSAAALVLPLRSTSAIATTPASLSALVVVARASSVITAPVSHTERAGAPTSTSSRGGPASTATLV